MNLEDIELSRRRLLAGILIIGIAAAGAGAGTVALFSDTEQSTNNEISAGVLDLSDPTNGTLVMTGLAPGDRVPASGNASFSTTYQSTDAIGDIQVNVSVSTSEPTPEPAEPSHSTDQTAAAFASEVNVTGAYLKVNGNVVSDISGSYNTLADLNGTTLNDAFGNVASGDTVSLDLEMEFDTTAGNPYQADGVNMTVSFEGTQIP